MRIAIYMTKTSKNFNKIFCIGMNKTGTSSLHSAFLKLGLKSLHHGYSEYKTLREHLDGAQLIEQKILENEKTSKNLLEHINEYDAYSDIGPIINKFEILDFQYPNSKFIYTDRNTIEWINSRKRHVMRNIAHKNQGLYESGFCEIDEEQWIERKITHLNRVKNYFKNRLNDLLIINITKGDGFEKLCPFLGFNVVADKFPQKNIIK
jgi:hypothetical protein